MLDLKVLVVKLRTVDARSARSIPIQEVPSLAHEPRNDAVHDAVLVPQRLTVPPALEKEVSYPTLSLPPAPNLPVLSSAKLTEVLCGSEEGTEVS